MNVHLRAPQFRVRIVPLVESVPEDLLNASIMHIRTARQMGSAAGSFQITLLPRAYHPPWSTRIQPMSYVEISLWVPPRPKQIVMRGFVDTVAETFSIESGTPHHQVIIAGRDFGKIPLITKLFYLDLDRKKIPQDLAPLPLVAVRARRHRDRGSVSGPDARGQAGRLDRADPVHQ